ncbi:DUF4180 domain-containing protein [Dactylosporangium sp. NPDC000555]|uniref:DUF4180 domain-containing protein n=1 Tax=Dactylosporangium sp. NPDC000555 TaxID=3154260 RepID=UPI0033316C19
MDRVEKINGVDALVLDDEGQRYGAELGAGDLVGAALSHGVELLVVPVGRLAGDFFVLRSGVAGEILQKLVNYRLRLAVIGDVSAHVAASDALRDLIRESNRGRDAWFLPDRAALEARLA